jgi:hypothetical protein
LTNADVLADLRFGRRNIFAPTHRWFRGEAVIKKLMDILGLDESSDERERENVPKSDEEN